MLYFSHLLRDEEMREIVRETGMGIESIEFSIAENLENLDKKLISYEKRLEYMECPALTLHGPFLDLNPVTFDSRIREVTMARYRQSYEAAKKLGASKIIYHTCHVPDFYLLIGWAERMADFYREFLEDRDENIQVVMENVLDRKPEPLLEVGDRVSRPSFGLCLDAGHANCYSPVSCLEWLETLKPRLSHLHLHDNRGKRDEHRAFGSGTLPAGELILAAREIENLTCCIECGAQEAVLESYEKIKKFWTPVQEN